MSYQPGTTLFNKYRVVRLLGSGAFGDVYLVLHRKSNTQHALKVLNRNSPGKDNNSYIDARNRFHLEAQLGSQLHMGGVKLRLLQVHELIEKDGLLALEMEFASGGSLADLIQAARKQGRMLPIAQVLEIAQQVAEGLALVHALDIVHRDLKPSNILFDGNGQAKLSDLGLAQLHGGPSMRSRLGSQAPRHPGTPGYMSPEQEHTTDYLRPASDIYALGLVLFEALTGRSYTNLKPGTLPSDLRKDIPRWLDELLSKMLMENPKDRIWDGVAAKEAIETAIQLMEQEKAKNRGAERESGEHEPDFQVVELGTDEQMVFVHVPAGEFLMGSDKQRDRKASRNELPQHKIYLDEYWIGLFPVTETQYAVFARTSGREKTSSSSRPMVNVSWYDANAFCEWASLKTGHIIRLPSEAEWEKAARGTDERIYPWGDAPPDNRCNFTTTPVILLDIAISYIFKIKPIGLNIIKPVGQFSPQGDSPYGCWDMSGNVWEWTRSIFDKYPYKINDTREALYAHGDRVLRGGSYNNFGRYVRCATRNRYSPDSKSEDIGFRVVASLSGSK